MPETNEEKVSLGIFDNIPILGSDKTAHDAQIRQIKTSVASREVKSACVLQIIDILKINPSRLEDKAALFDRMKGVASLGFPEISINIKTA